MDVVIPSALFGLLFSALFTITGFLAAATTRDFGVHNYPPAIQDRYGPKSERGRDVTAIVGAVLGLLIAGLVTACLLAVRSQTGEPLGFVTAFLGAEVMLMTFNVFDLLALDWLLFCTLRPRMIVLPGTAGMEEYGDLAFHAAGFMRGTVIVSFLSLIAAAVAVIAESVF